MYKVLFVTALAVLSLQKSHAQKKPATYEITGTITGFADSTWLYLDVSPTRTDSALLIRNSVRFTGHIEQESVQVMLYTKAFDNYKFFWLENAPIAFKAAKGTFRNATISGSKTQDLNNELESALKNSPDEKQQYISFIRTHPASIISAYILSVYASTWGKETTMPLYEALSKANKATEYGKKVGEFISLNKNIKIGSRYADFEAPSLAGTPIRVSDFAGKVTLLEFWGSWCGPCRENHKELVKIYEEFKAAGFEILGVAAETNKDAWAAAIQKDGLQWPNVSELKGDRSKAALIYGISYYPANFLIDKNGVIVAQDLRGEALRKKLQELLN
jgi:peroxiredoxin